MSSGTYPKTTQPGNRPVNNKKARNRVKIIRKLIVAEQRAITGSVILGKLTFFRSAACSIKILGKRLRSSTKKAKAVDRHRQKVHTPLNHQSLVNFARITREKMTV